MADSILFDTYVALDFVLQRNPGYPEAQKLWRANIKGQIIGYITALAIKDVFYVASKGGRDVVQGYFAVTACLSTLRVCPVNRQSLDRAIILGRHDFEDAIQITCALAEGLDAIVTSNVKDFRNAGITLFTPAQLVKKLKLR